ncbi:response regulator [Aggregatimonas sangjinii]|uniref:histidine kinase n=1 Tax=Aggregatimonas sangjinii TaxID=2583587 RepID=A0A5B7SKC8_9FLAO|nr:hybrid sensor histidine kinase/response regulator transcription factor [Aggregatimonas sangjinii]QCW98936.1 response regulator [Aggregatimonas sangjinii]
MNKLFQYKNFVWILFLVYATGFAQTHKPNIKSYSLEDGLSKTNIFDLLRDSSGFVWIGTSDGLNRFDGYSFRHFKPNASDTTAISGNYINKLLEDKNGNIWVGTLDGLDVYHPDTETFKKIVLNAAKNRSVTSLEIQDNGTLWVGTRNTGVYRLLPIGQKKFEKDNFLNATTITSLFIDSQEQLWIGGLEGDIFTIDLKQNTTKPKLLQLNIEGRVQAFYRFDKKLFIGTEVGFYIYDILTKFVKKVNLSELHQGTAKQITEFLDAGSLGVWIGTGSGLFLFDRETEKVLQKIEYDDNDVNGLSNNQVFSLLQLTQNQLFVGTNSNLDLLDFNGSYFKNFSKNKEGEHLLNANSTPTIFKDDENIWVGTDGGLNLITNDSTYYFREDQSNPNSISGNVIREIQKDTQNHRLWIATLQGLNMIDLKTFNPHSPFFKTYTYDSNNRNSISNDLLKSITLDQENNVWGATFGQGIFRLHLNGKGEVDVVRFKNDTENANSLINNFVEKIMADTENVVWAGTQGGLSRLSFADNSLKNPIFTNKVVLEKSRNSPEARPSVILDMTVDSKGNRWFASTYGLNLYLGNNEFKTWTDQQMSLDGLIFSVQHDDDDKLWMGTTAGIIGFNPETEDFKIYGIADGIQKSDFILHAKFKDQAGTIYLGGKGGLTYFHPKDLEKIDHSEPLYFSQLRVKDEIAKTTNASKPWLTSAINKTEMLQFEHDEFPFYLDFSSIDYRLNKDVSFAYKLLPTDTGWNILRDREIQFLNLPTGNYTLQVNGFSRGQEWSDSPLEMNLVILPPWWATWWAYLIYLGLATALVYGFYRFQLSKRLAISESLRLKEVSQLKSSLYDNITHEFRTPLTVILGMTDSLESELRSKTNPPIKNAVEMIRRNGKNLLSLVNEMLDLSKLESGQMDTHLGQMNVIPFIKYLGESFHSFAQEDDIHFTVYCEIDELMMDTDSQKLSTIISNLLSNAIKFTPPLGKIVLHIRNEKDTMLVMKVTDTGTGITQEELPHIFNRFYQADASVTRKRDGTGIGLALTKELVQLLGGEIEVQSTPNEGSIFKVALPITRNAPKTSVDLLQRGERSVSQLAAVEFKKITDLNEDLPLVLIIEDNKDVAYYLNQCLNGYYKTIHAINGIVGLEMAFEHTPDIVISDVMMPGKDGYEVCRMLKEDQRTDHIPIVLLTAKVTAKDRVLGLTQGADAYLAKPFLKEELFARLEQLLFLRKKLIAKFQQGQISKILAKQPKNTETIFIAKVIELIHEELDNASFGVSKLSSKLGLSESQVYRKLKAITGKSTAIFIRTIRLESAKEQLRTTDKTVSEIAYAVGFNDPSWFSRAFKEEYGVAPGSIFK